MRVNRAFVLLCWSFSVAESVPAQVRLSIDATDSVDLLLHESRRDILVLRQNGIFRSAIDDELTEKVAFDPNALIEAPAFLQGHYQALGEGADGDVLVAYSVERVDRTAETYVCRMEGQVCSRLDRYLSVHALAESPAGELFVLAFDRSDGRLIHRFSPGGVHIESFVEHPFEEGDPRWTAPGLGGKVLVATRFLVVALPYLGVIHEYDHDGNRRHTYVFQSGLGAEGDAEGDFITSVFKSGDQVYAQVVTGNIRRHPEGRVQVWGMRDPRVLVLENGIAASFCESEVGRHAIGFLTVGERLKMVGVSRRVDEMGNVLLYPVDLSAEVK
jgi:hypothetical protein